MTQTVTRLACAPPLQHDSGGTAPGEVPAAALSALLDAVPQPLLLIDARAALRYANHVGADFLRRGHSLRLRGQTLIAANPADTARLHRAIATAELSERRALLTVGCAAGDEQVAVLLWRVARPTARLVAVFAGVSMSGSVDAGMLRPLYGLTPAEARVAVLIAAGRSLSDIAAQLQIGRSTVRTHLQRVFAKTGAGRQSALASLLLSGPGRLRLPREPDDA